MIELEAMTIVVEAEGKGCKLVGKNAIHVSLWSSQRKKILPYVKA